MHTSPLQETLQVLGARAEGDRHIGSLTQKQKCTGRRNLRSVAHLGLVRPRALKHREVSLQEILGKLGGSYMTQLHLPRRRLWR